MMSTERTQGPSADSASENNSTPRIAAPLSLHEYSQFTYRSYHVAHPLFWSHWDTPFTHRDSLDHEHALVQALTSISNYPGSQHHPDGLAASLGSLCSRCITSSDVIHSPMWNRSSFIEAL